MLAPTLTDRLQYGNFSQKGISYLKVLLSVFSGTNHLRIALRMVYTFKSKVKPPNRCKVLLKWNEITLNNFWSWIRILFLIRIWISQGPSSPIYSVTGHLVTGRTLPTVLAGHMNKVLLCSYERPTKEFILEIGDDGEKNSNPTLEVVLNGDALSHIRWGWSSWILQSSARLIACIVCYGVYTATHESYPAVQILLHYSEVRRDRQNLGDVHSRSKWGNDYFLPEPLPYFFSYFALSPTCYDQKCSSYV